MCTKNQFMDKLTEGLRLATEALRNNGDVVVDELSAHVSFITMQWIHFGVEIALTSHDWCLKASRQVGKQPGHVGLKGFLDCLTQVDMLSTSFVDLAECALIGSIPRLRELHPDKQWLPDEISALSGLRDKANEFARSEGIDMGSELTGWLAALVEALQPTINHRQKQSYGAVKVLVGVYADGKDMSNAEEVVQKLPAPTGENSFVRFCTVLLGSGHTITTQRHRFYSG